MKTTCCAACRASSRPARCSIGKRRPGATCCKPRSRPASPPGRARFAISDSDSLIASLAAFDLLAQDLEREPLVFRRCKLRLGAGEPGRGFIKRFAVARIESRVVKPGLQR